jgi:hypothetical protein
MMLAALISELVFSSAVGVVVVSLSSFLLLLLLVVVILVVVVVLLLVLCILCVMSVGVILVFLLNSHTETTPLLLLMGFEIYLVMYMVQIFLIVM